MGFRIVCDIVLSKETYYRGKRDPLQMLAWLVSECSLGFSSLWGLGFRVWFSIGFRVVAADRCCHGWSVIVCDILSTKETCNRGKGTCNRGQRDPLQMLAWLVNNSVCGVD